jgi:thiol-disulfide isomerase/thioredoxin
MARQTKAKRREEKRRELERKRREEARKKAIRNGVLGIGGLVGVAVLLVALWPSPSAEDIEAERISNTTREAWDLPELDGDGRIRLADFRGKPTIAAFFANWCSVCENEIPELLALSKQIGDQVNFVGIDMMDNGGGLGDARKWGIAGEWPLARDVGNGNGSLLSAGTFGARGSPLNVVYDAGGRVVRVIPGGVSADNLLSFLEDEGLIDL